MKEFTITGELTDLNTYVNAERTNRYAGAEIKKTETFNVAAQLRKQRVQPITKIEVMLCRWYTKDLKKDADNVQFAVKFILDGMVKAGVLKNDSRKFTGKMCHEMFVDKRRPRVEVLIVEP